MTLPKVALIILTWNGKDDTIECLESLKKITYKNYEIIIVDNASKDNVSQIINENYPYVKLITNSTNRGFSGGNNDGLNYALKTDADYFLLLNNDVIVAPDFLDKLIMFAETDPKIGIVSPLIYYYDRPSIVWSAGLKIRLLGLYNLMNFIGKDDKNIPEIFNPQVVSGAGLCVKREVVEKIGLLDELYFTYCEDVDFCYRARFAGYEIFTVKSSKIWHKVSASTGGSFNPLNQYFMARGRSIFIKKFGSRLEKMLFIPLAIIEFCYINLRELLKNNIRSSLPKFHGYIDGWKMKPVSLEMLENIKKKYSKKEEA